MKFKSFIYATVIALGTVATPILTNPSMAFNGPHEEEGFHQATTKKSCGGLFRQAKKNAKDKAKRFCRMTYGSGGRAVTNTKWMKNSCSKTNNSAIGTYTFFCK